jgi:2-polyprenyl-3-methyl-5-hydroxy-6-metoxy-1,4-benzoquinol methylase
MPVDPTADNNPHSYALQMVGSGRHLLELGCATGHVTEQLVAAGNRVVGVEFDAVAAEEARRYADRVHVLDLDVERVSSVESDRFEMIIAGDVLEHLRDPLPPLLDVLTLLEPDGEVIISVPNLAFADVRLLVLEGRIEYQDEGLLDRTHLRWFTLDSLRQLLEAAGLSAVEVRRVTHPLGASRLPVDWAAHSDATTAFVLSDPEALTYQFVVRCRRTTEVAAASDLLAVTPHQWPAHRCEAIAAEHEALLEKIAALEGAIDAWERSRVVRLTKPLRTLRTRLRRARAAPSSS